MTRLGDFLTDFGDKFLTKIAEILGLLLGLFKNRYFFLSKTVVATLWPTFGKKLGKIYIPTSGHISDTLDSQEDIINHQP